MFEKLSATLLAAACFSLTAIPASSQGNETNMLTIRGGGNIQQVDCDGRAVSIQGASNEITLTGNCPSLLVRGGGNIVSIEIRPGGSISVRGASNVITWYSDARPRVTLSGANNRVHAGNKAATARHK